MSGGIRALLKRIPGLQHLARTAGRSGQPDAAALAELLPKGAWLWCDLEVRRRIQAHGINVVPANFYSNTPTIADIEGSFEYADAGHKQPPYDLGLDEAAMQAELESLMPYASEFTPPKGDPGDGGYFWDAGLFGFSDAMAYYCYLRKLRPKTVLEIGSGFSSLVALMGLKANGTGHLVCAEPFPRDFLKDRADITLVQKPAQVLAAEYFNDTLADGDVLFIDSTHTVKSGSDCLHIYLRILPKLRRRLHVHVHDIYLPFAIPRKQMLERQIHWTEQYLLMAFLLDNPKARVLYGSWYHAWRNPQMLERFMQGKALPGGSSFWFEYRGAA